MAQFPNPPRNHLGASTRLFPYYYEPSKAFPLLLYQPSGEKYTFPPSFLKVLRPSYLGISLGEWEELGDVPLMHALLELEFDDEVNNYLIMPITEGE